jgi:uncharacterized protein (TIGR02300 family)
VAKPEWGVKRVCQSCATKFYDLGRHPIACPKCGTRFNPEALLKSRRSRPAGASKPSMAQTGSVHPGKTEPEETTAVGLGADLGEDGETGTEASENDDSVIGDASELGESDDVVDVAITDDEDD